VHPHEVEGALLTHPDVTDCAVVGVPDPTWGETVAAVVATSGAPAERELQDWVRRTLAGYKVPRRIVLVERLPRTPTGKLEVARAREIVERAPA
jgi:acyl-coenzyme A synthetase/AMP-(fatty) acid ligase